jgi:predicted nucleic acid-binding protein
VAAERLRRLLDTDVVSYIMDGKPEAGEFLAHIEGYQQAISFATFGELLRGGRARGWSIARVAELERYVFRYHVVLPYSVEVAREWGRLMATCSGRGFTPGQNDAWIAASALAFDCALVARDTAFATMARHEPRLRVLP